MKKFYTLSKALRSKQIFRNYSRNRITKNDLGVSHSLKENMVKNSSNRGERKKQ